jgi:hypothetical protein
MLLTRAVGIFNGKTGLGSSSQVGCVHGQFAAYPMRQQGRAIIVQTPVKCAHCRPCDNWLWNNLAALPRCCARIKMLQMLMWPGLLQCLYKQVRQP